MNLTISRQAIDDAIRHAQELAPIESCGYMSGTTQLIRRYIPMTNIDQSSDHFTFDPKEQFQAMKAARADGETLLVVVHSHPVTPPRLSAEDIRLFNDSAMNYLVVSLRNPTPEYTMFRLNKFGAGTLELTTVALTLHD
ncbi:M67 family peptidase [bacterium]|nr:M67 family peptidase [bacterium]